MRLIKVRISRYRSIEESTEFEIDSQVTCLVGKNEAGKTAILKVLEKLNPVNPGVQFNVIKDYPRRLLTEYDRRHATLPDVPIVATFELDEGEIRAIDEAFCSGLCRSRTLLVTKNYANALTQEFDLDEAKLVAHLVATSALDEDAKGKAAASKDLASLVLFLKGIVEKPDGVTKLLAQAEPLASQPLRALVWDRILKAKLPSFMFFDDYSVMHGSASLDHLLKPEARADHRLLPLLDLLDLAQTTPQALKNEQNNYEEHKARLEATANKISDEVFEYWKQNKSLEVEFDVAPGEQGAPPHAQGLQVLRVRIKNQRHRATVPFDERSRGFVWFFSFLSRFDKIGRDGTPLILLLDEPALSLHASAQSDFLRFMDERLAPKHQVVFTTHSPFMINSEAGKLSRVRTVEDLDKKGTTVSKDVLVTDPATAFPLQAALGYTLAQSLFLGPNCLLVEGPSDLLYLQAMSEVLRRGSKQGLDPRWVITPVGGADRLAVFATLLGSNKLNVVVLMDFSKQDEQRLTRLLEEHRLQPQKVIRVSEFVGAKDADIEDLFGVSLFLQLVSAAYPQTKGVAESDLPPDSRLTKRMDKLFTARELGTFSHYAPASLANAVLASATIPAEVIARFEAMFGRVNALL